MAIHLTTRDKLISEGMRQVLAHGYEGIGIGPILQSVNVPKGSFYHFFKSKDDYVIAIIDAYEDKYRSLRGRIFEDEALSPLARLDKYFEILERELLDRHPSGGCLYGVLAQTVTARNPVVRERLTTSFEQWEMSIADLLRNAVAAGQLRPDADVTEITALLIDAYEGALIRMKATDDVSAFRRFRTIGLAMLTGVAAVV